VIRLELLNIEGKGYTVIVDDKFSSHLGIEEALGCVASALFGEKVMYVQTYEQWLAWERRHNSIPDKPAGLLEYRPAAELQRVEHQRDHLLSVVDDLEHSISKKEPYMKGIMTKCDGDHALNTLCTDRDCWQGEENPVVRLYKNNQRLATERKAYADAILIHLAGIVSTPESGYLNDGGVGLAERNLNEFRGKYFTIKGNYEALHRDYSSDFAEFTAAKAKYSALMEQLREHGEQWDKDLLKQYMTENDCLSDVCKDLVAVRDNLAARLKDSLFRPIDMSTENTSLKALVEDSAKPSRKFVKGDSVLVYDRYRFAIPLAATIWRFSETNDGVQVVIHESNNVRYPIDSEVWVHQAQLRHADGKES
jgi:hypothetical protein